MTKHLKRATILAAVLSVSAGLALAQVSPPWGGWGWRFGPPNGYFSGTQVDRSKVDGAVKQTLDKAAKGQSWTNPGGVKLTPIMVGNEIVGQLWEDADLKTLTVGSSWAGPWGVNVQLVKDGKVIGMVWVKLS
jgi:hypothetical protein